MTEGEAREIILGKQPYDTSMLRPGWALNFIPDGVDYRREGGIYYVEGHSGPSLGIALARYWQSRTAIMLINLDHDAHCRQHIKCHCRLWGVTHDDRLIARLRQQSDAVELIELLRKNQ